MGKWAARASWALSVLIPLVFLGLFFAWPVGAMLVRGFTAEGTVDFSGFSNVLGQRRTWLIVWQTVWMAAAGTAVSVVLGIPGAYVLYRCTFPGRRALRAIATFPFVLPTVVVGVAFRALLGTGGPYAALGLDGTTAAVVLAMVFFNYSLVIRTVGSMWAVLDRRAEEAARTLGAGRARTFLTVTLPALRPAIGAAASMVFLFCSTAYGIVQTLGRPGYGTLETEIWVQTITYLDLRTAAVLSFLQFVIVGIAVIISSKLRSHNVALRMNSTSERPLRASDAVPAAITGVVIAGLIIAPMAALAARAFTYDGTWSLQNFRLLQTSGSGFTGGATVIDAIGHSVRIAFDATWIALIVGILMAVVLSRPTRGALAKAQHALDAFVLLPLGVSAVTVGFGFFIALKGPPMNLGSSGMLVPIAQAVVALPLVVRSLVPVLQSIDPRLREAAATLGAGPFRVLWSVDGPFMIRGLGIATGFAFAISLGEFGATSFLASPEYVTLPVIIARLLGRPGADNYGMAMAGAVLLAVGTAGVMALSEMLRPRTGVKGAM